MRALIIEDDTLLAQCLGEQMVDWGFECRTASTLAGAMDSLQWLPEFVVLDVRLPDGSGVELARRLLGVSPFPTVVAISGAATASEAFELAQTGVRGYLPKPINVEDLRATLHALISDPPAIEPLARAQVGSASYSQATTRMRRAMVEQALALAGGNKTGAARLLKVSRQAVQQLIESLDIQE